MPIWQSPNYKRLQDGSKRLHAIILNKKAEDALAIRAVEALVNLEAYKAELRGKPRIKPCELKDAPARQRRPKVASGPRDVTTTPKESLSNGQP